MIKDFLQGVAIGLSWVIFVGLTAYLWTAMRILTDNSMTKHKKVCDMCFRDIKRWTEARRASTESTQQDTRSTVSVAESGKNAETNPNTGGIR